MEIDDSLKDSLANMLEMVDRLGLQGSVDRDLVNLRLARENFENDVTRLFGPHPNVTSIEVFIGQLNGDS